MRRLSAVVSLIFIVLLPAFAAAQHPAQHPAQQPAQQPATQDSPESKLTEAEVQAEIRRLEVGLQRHWDDPQAPEAWKEHRKLTRQLQELWFRQREGRDAIEKRISELGNRDDVKRWIAEADRISERQNRLRYRDYHLVREAGRKLRETRHAELAGLSVKETPELDRLGLDVLRFPRLDGSTSTRPPAALIACRTFDMPYAWSGLPLRRQQFDPYDYDELSLPYGPPEPEVELLEFTLQARVDDPATARLGVIINRLPAANASTPQSYVNLIEGRSDMGLLARRPSADELELAKKLNVELEVTPFAWDAFVFLVNAENPVRNLSTAQIRDIYSGRVADWKEVGGPAGTITPYQRERNSGSQELMQTLVMKELPFGRPKDENPYFPNLIGHGMIGVFLELTSDKEGLAYSVYYYERFMAGSGRTQTIAVDGVEPTYETIRDRKYPYATEVLIVTRKGLPADSPTAQLRAWMLGDEGQAVVRESGYVPLTPAEP